MWISFLAVLAIPENVEWFMSHTPKKDAPEAQRDKWASVLYDLERFDAGFPI
jgi:hypothetical protein